MLFRHVIMCSAGAQRLGTDGRERVPNLLLPVQQHVQLHVCVTVSNTYFGIVISLNS